MLAIEPEAPLFEESVAEDEALQLEGEEEQGIFINNNEEVRDENHDEDKEGLTFSHEENVVSDNETFIENEVDAAEDVGAVAQMNEAAEEVTAADIDDVPVPNSVPRRINAGKGIERLQMNFQRKACQSKWKCNFIANSASAEAKGETGNSADSYMKVA